MGVLLVASTDHGVLVYRKGAAGSWELEAEVLKDWGVEEAMAVPGEPGTILAATRGDGVWLSRDAGRSWKKPSYGRRGPGKLRCLALDLRNPGRVYAGGEPIDIWVSDDLGATWDRLDSIQSLPTLPSIRYPVPAVEPHVRDVTLDPSDPDTIYAALQVGSMIKSSDGGCTWQLLENGLDADVHAIAVDPDDRDHVFAATGGGESRSGRVKGRALYQSQDAGATWSPTAMEFTQEYSIPLVMHPRNPDILFSSVANGTPGAWSRPTGAEAALIRTLDGGRTWERLGGESSELSGFFAGAIAIDESEPDHVYAALNSGEVVASNDGGDSWVRLGIKAPRAADLKVVRD
jgi:photosystem II stability/assembly factor-like uncharacterized protein